MGRTGRLKRYSKFFEKLRQKRAQRKTKRIQRGGNPLAGLLLNADAPELVPTEGLDFNVRFQPTVKASEQGPKFTTYQTAHEPYPVWTAPTPPHKYTILCWDPDVKEGKSFLHWLVINCSGTDPSSGIVKGGWQAPSPPPGTGEHRYILGLLRQPKDIDIPDVTERSHFHPINFANTHGLSAVAYRGFRVETPPIFVPEIPPVSTPSPPPA